MERARLITIGISHYCEKVRWALDRAGVPYEEEAHVPVLHLAATSARGLGRTTPILIEGERVMRDSTDILLALDPRTPETLRIHPTDPALRAEALEHEDRFDEALGAPVRKVAWYHLIRAPEAFAAVLDGMGPRWERSIAKKIPGAFAKALEQGIGLSDQSAQRATETIDRVVDEASAALGGKRWLVGDAFSVADLTLASLLAPILAPPEHPFPYPQRDAIPEGLRAIHDRVRATPAGELALRAYREERARRPS